MISTRLSIIIGALVGGFTVFLCFSIVNDLVLLPQAEENGRALERADTLKKAIDLVNERSRTNADIQKLDDAGICRELDGVWRDGICH